MKISDIKPEVFTLAKEAEAEIKERFEDIDRIAELNTIKVMSAFQDNKVSDACFAGTSGYGYDDLGREVLDKVYAQVFKTEAALVRIGFVNGTHALTAALFALLKIGLLRLQFSLLAGKFCLAGGQCGLAAFKLGLGIRGGLCHGKSLL